MFFTPHRKPNLFSTLAMSHTTRKTVFQGQLSKLSEVLVDIIDCVLPVPWPELTFTDCQSPLFSYTSFLSPFIPFETPLNEVAVFAL